MTVADLILELQKLPQDATVIGSSKEYPEEVTSVSEITRNHFDGYYSPGFHRNVNRDVVVRLA